MRKQYEMPNLYVVAFTGEVDTTTCSSESGVDFGKGASTYGLTPCPDPGTTPDTGTIPGEGGWGPIQ